MGELLKDLLSESYCKSRLPPEIKKEKIVVDEKIGQKRVNKEELSRGTVSSEGTEDSSESENGETILEGKKQVTGEEKVKKGLVTLLADA
ncbi:hypothetical protein RhiirA5_418129 [Rhizophagus irregularis]|uniref:Uncharacterized protein n=3 Tax=Rhizophagus irregularis TaxID=588596 RepID=A0A2N0PL17_9GLOM|nr:hypothetical protein GLOIN_2v1770794 [Rhizophagus irregularis DAOM 181602=DAOM 197198]PKC07505.1 hypothetical protein RhiirA5_418129 [Rhizophagus irregularis]POG74955.1 hypothetical protein GLOIN_2v1770794 [Rhizophagus irregularis DAOM 181602=DAOM 197198]GET58638.1 hypothetical protein GLOIN_2v1770794 [Rhizophagus irregularis DAOM 181602=DAOM 197198]|eukprot:XP_025181821.1 hypothetical protein GLOIN_2v1770794 [Rhizophagus irregularis DAOM 181602=DAOM 197198]